MQRFSVLIKPASSLCNMRCQYCFYHDVASCRTVPSYGIMTEETARRIIRWAFDAVHSPAVVSFAFQGGEPSLAGLPFFEKFAAYAEEINQGRFEVEYSFQTNGLLIDDAWADFFARRRFLIGVYLDMDARFHDRYRLDAQGEATFRRIQQSIRRLEAHKAEYNLLSVLTKDMARHPQQVFRCMEALGCRFFQIIPCLRPLQAPPSSHDLSPQDYAAFMKTLTRLWLEALKKGKPISIRQLDNLVQMLLGYPPEQCGMQGSCSPQFVIEADGSVYPCDFYVLDGYRMGSVYEQSPREMLSSQGNRRFLEDRVPEGALCSSCPVYSLCAGGCRRYRSFYQEIPGYCPQQDFLLSSLPALREAVSLVSRR